MGIGDNDLTSGKQNIFKKHSKHIYYKIFKYLSQRYGNKTELKSLAKLDDLNYYLVIVNITHTPLMFIFLQLYLLITTFLLKLNNYIIYAHLYSRIKMLLTFLS